MNEDLQRIRRAIDRLVRRERWLLLLRLVLQGGLLLAGCLVFALAAAAWDWNRALATVVVVLALGGGGWPVVGLPLYTRWRRAGDRLAQAQRVEALRPSLRGRLLTAVERADGPRGDESAAILALVARRAVEQVQSLPAVSVHSARPLRPWAAGAILAWALVLVVGLAVPGGPKGALGWWLEAASAQAAVDLHDDGLLDPQARIGDIDLTYLYPEHTGLEPLRVANTTGDVHGPPGTRVGVTALAAERVEAAALVAYDEAPLEATVTDERLLEGSFTIQSDPGTWHLVVYRRGEATPSRSFEIAVEPDLPPEVHLHVEGRVIEAAVDQSLAIPWRARDDYGVRRATLEVDGVEQRPPVASWAERRIEVSGLVRVRPADLGLVPGQRVVLQLAAWDNDTWSGSKAGRSQPVELVVLGAAGIQARNDERYAAIRDLMLDILADHLEEPWPPGRTSGRMASWGEELAERYEPLDLLLQEFEAAFRFDALDTRKVEQVHRAGRELIRYTQVAFQPGSTEIPPDEAFQVAAGMREDVIASLEDAILALDTVLRNHALRDVAEAANELAQTAETLREMLDGDAEAQELLARLDQLERLLAELASRAAMLRDGGLREFVNSRTEQMRDLLDEIRQAIAAGRLDEARELMDRLAEQLQQLSEGVGDQIRSQQEQGDQVGQAVEQLQDELAELEQAQRDLQEQVHQLREQGGQEAMEQADELWQEVELEAEELLRLAQVYIAGLEDGGRGWREKEVAGGTASDAQRLLEAVRARDLHRAHQKVDDVEYGARASRSAYDYARLFRGEDLPGPGDADLDDIEDQARAVEMLLDRLSQMAGSTDPEVGEQIRELSQAQQALQERLQRAGEQAQQIAQALPVRPRGMEEGLEDAEEHMSQAVRDLRRGEPMPAEGSQGSAAQRIADAREALEQAMQDAAAMQSALEPRPQEMGEGGGQSDGGDGNQWDPEDLDIPSPEDFLTPEAYRRALLQGMEGEVPDEYRQLKKRYYEELVQQ